MTSLIDTAMPRVQNAKRNMKAFGSCADAPPAALWFDKQFPPFINFDQESLCTRLSHSSRLVLIFLLL
jgi:hypothetical protein